MTFRESIHKLVDTLPEERLSSAFDYLVELGDDTEVSSETRSAIAEGLADIRDGRTTPFEELRRKYEL
jgi:hypothetical protein